ncbi:histidine kinase [filamentous cyanobacterium CCP5]|nr:histidine kinase [filamentous cyanobacterium CCP5]
MGLVGYLSLRNGQRTVNTLANQIRQELTARIERELRGYFEIPHEINRLNAAAFARGEIDVVGARYGEPLIYQQMKVAPTVAFAYCGSSRRGEFFGVLRSPDTGELQLSYGNSGNNFLRDYYSLDVVGNRTYLVDKADKRYDARQRPWYGAAVNAEGPAWTDVYIAFTTGLPNVTASLPVYDRSGRQLLGVCATDVVLPEEFRDFLRNLKIGTHGQAFVVDRSGGLIANSNDEPLMVENGGTPRSLLATESSDPLVRGTANYILQSLGGFESITKIQRLDFDLEGDRQFLEVVPFQDGFGLDWLIVVVVPEVDFMGQIYAHTRMTALLIAGAMGVAIGLAIWASRTLSRPVLEVCQASEEMAKGHLDQQVNPTPIREMFLLTRSFNHMARQLQTSFTALRQSEATSRGLIEAIPDLLIRARRDGTYLTIVGRDRLLQVHDDAKFLPGSQVQDSLPSALTEQRLHHIQMAIQTGSLQIYEQQLVVNGHLQHEEVRIMPLEDGDVLIMVRDITQRKRAEKALRIAEETYRSIYENALEGIFQSSLDGRFLKVNPAMAEIYGYDSPEEMIASITDISTQVYVDPNGRDIFRAHLAQTGEVKDFEYQIYRRDGSIIWVQENTRAVRDDNNHFLYFEGIIQEISERKFQEQELKRKIETLQIEIDQQRVEETVEQITNSSYFQDLRAEIAKINPDTFWS